MSKKESNPQPPTEKAPPYPSAKKRSVWILTKEYNEYDQYGEYFKNVYFKKPTAGQLSLAGVDHTLIELCLTKGGGRPSTAYDWWWHLNEHEEE